MRRLPARPRPTALVAAALAAALLTACGSPTEPRSRVGTGTPPTAVRLAPTDGVKAESADTTTKTVVAPQPAAQPILPWY